MAIKTNIKGEGSRSMSNGDTTERLDIVELRLFIEELAVQHLPLHARVAGWS